LPRCIATDFVCGMRGWPARYSTRSYRQRICVFAGHRRVRRIRGLGRPRDPRTAKFIATLAQRVPAF